MDLSLFQSILVSHAHETVKYFIHGARDMLGVMVRLPSVQRPEGVMQDVKLQASFNLFCLVEVVPILYPRNLNKA